MHTSTALQAFVAHIVDYAGIFPPSQVPLDEAVQNFAVYRRGEDAPMLGRMIVPASRLHEVDPEGQLTIEPPYPFSAIARGGADQAAFLAGLKEDLEEIVRFRRRLDGNVAVHVLEARLPEALLAEPHATTMREFADAVARPINDEAPETLQPFYEVPLSEQFESQMRALLAGLKEHHEHLPAPGSHPHHTYVPAGVKLRCGGTAEPPSSEQVALAIELCREARVPLKFTAGLHHAIRKPDRSGYPHGFVNLFAAGVLSLARPDSFDRARLLELINDEQPESFQFDDKGMSWRGVHATVGQVREGRKLFTSFGSCSFDDPRTDLRAYGWLATVR